VTGEEEKTERLLYAGGVEARFVPPLAAYTRLVLAANSKFNLTGARTAEQFVPHILDSLTIVPYVRSPYIDIGSGAGLPGIPVALVTEAGAVLLEATEKKAAFLREAIDALRLTAARVVTARAEDAGRDPELRERFESATVRAVASAPAALELVAPFLAIGGLAILQRGLAGTDEQASLDSAALALGFEVEPEVALAGERRVLLFRKAAPTPEGFPRRPGMAQKRPLGG
jgi:16S rRNA (guanine527-N7)-methyltransferase